MEAEERPPTVEQAGLAVGVAELLVHRVLAWFVIIFALPGWLVWRRRWRREQVSFGQYIGWVDLNLIAALERSLFRPALRQPMPWVPVAAIATVTHRVDWERDVAR